MPFGDNEVGLDTLASEHILRSKSLVSNFRRASQPLHLSGIQKGAQEQRVEFCGDTAVGVAYWSKHVNANLLSAGRLKMAGHNLTFDHVKDQFVLRLPAGDPLVFTHRHDHVYTCRVKDKEHFRRLSIVPASNRTPCSALLTATEHDQEFTKREIDKAREAQDLVRKLAYPSTSALLHAMRSGALIGTSVTARDVDRALILWGPDVAALKGRTTGHRSPKIPEVRRRLARQQQSLHCDVMFIERQPFLLAVAKPSQYVYVTPMRNKTAADIGRALRAQIAHASAHNVLINEIRSDPESGLVAVAEELMRAGILPEITAATEAVPAAERAIRLVKERVRCVVNGLPFRLPLGLLAAAVQYCVQRLNMLPSTVSQSPGASARELFTGLKTDASRDLRLKFGEYVQVHTAKTCNSLKPRTEGCIALYGSDNLSGSWHMFGLKTGRTTVRQRWTQLPTPAEVIERMNDLAHGGVVLLDAAHSERGLDETVDAAEPVQEASASTVPTNYEDDYEVAGTTYEPDELPATYLSSEDADLPDKHESAREDDQLAAASEQARLPSIRDATNTSPSPSPRMLQHQQSPKLASDDAEALHGNPVHEHDDLEPTGNPGVPGAAENPGVLGPAENPGVHKSAENLGGHETAEELGAHESAEGSGPQHPIGDYWPSPSPASESVRFKEQAIEIKPDRKRKAPTNGEQQEACEPPEDLLKRSHSIIMELKRTAGAMPQRGKRARKPSTRTSMSKRKATGVVEPDEISKRARAFLTTLKHASVMHLSAKAACRQYGAGALQAVVAEVAQMLPRHGKDVLHPVALRDMSWAQRRMIIPSHLFVKAQTWANGDLKKIKARLVAGGNLQDKSLYPDASSPTASTNALFLIAALAAQENRAVASIDFPGAFLNAQMPDNPPTYIRLNRFLANTLVAIEPRYQAQQNVDGTMICRLNKALYGTILASKLWYEKLTGLLVKLRFVPNPYDACVWNREQHGRQVTVVLHVDDVFVSAPSESDIDGLIREIEHEYDGVERHRGKVLSYVGMVFDFNTPGIVSVSMPGYVETVLKDSAVSGRSSSPAGTNLFAVSNKVERLSGPRADRFHSLVCKLLYMAKRARPDLLTAVSFLSTRVSAPTVEDERKLQRALRYLSTTRDLGVAFAVSSPPTASVDAAFAVHEGMTSHTGVAISLGRGAIFAKSSKQKVVTKSSTEAELVAVSDNVGQLIWTRNFLAAQGVDFGAAHLLQDNMSTMAMIANGRPNSSRTRHMHIRHFFVTDKVKNGEVVVHHCPSDGMTADVLTKPLQGARFQKLRDQLLGRTPFRAKQAGSVLKNTAVQLPTDEPHDEEAAGACIGAAAGTAEAPIS